MVQVRAVDLGFGFVGLSTPSDQHYTTHQEKTWCPPRTGCQSWHGSSASCTVGGAACTAEHIASQHETPHAKQDKQQQQRQQQQQQQHHTNIVTEKKKSGGDGMSSVPGHSYRSGWQPPFPLPWAFKALQKAGRSSFAGGSSPSNGVGYAVWSTQSVTHCIATHTHARTHAHICRYYDVRYNCESAREH